MYHIYLTEYGKFVVADSDDTVGNFAAKHPTGFNYKEEAAEFMIEGQEFHNWVQSVREEKSG